MPSGVPPLSLHDALPISERVWRTAPEARAASGESWPNMRLARVSSSSRSDRKSTRLNSSHLGISYAVRCSSSFPTRRSSDLGKGLADGAGGEGGFGGVLAQHAFGQGEFFVAFRSEEHTSELQSLRHLVCRPVFLLFPYTTLFRSRKGSGGRRRRRGRLRGSPGPTCVWPG